MKELKINVTQNLIPGTVASYEASINEKLMGRIVVVCREEKGRIIFRGAVKKFAFIIDMFVFPEQRGKKQDVDTLLIDVLKKKFDVIRRVPRAPADFENLPKWKFKEVTEMQTEEHSGAKREVSTGVWEWRKV